MLCVCHPRLVEKPKIESPEMEANGNLFTFIYKYSKYIECEKISNRHYTDMRKPTHIIDALDTDSLFKKAFSISQIQKNMYDEMLKTKPNITFLHLLILNAGPYIIMKVHSESEKYDIFGTNNTNPTILAIKLREYTRNKLSNPTAQTIMHQ